MVKELTRAQIQELYQPPINEFVVVQVPEMRYFMLDGEGGEAREPLETAAKWLWTVVHPIRLQHRKRLGKRFIEPPLQCLWWADDVADFVAGRKEEMKWRMMIPAPDDANEHFDQALSQAVDKLGAAPMSLRLGVYEEGECLQTMYVGPNEEEVVTIERMHEILTTEGFVPSGPHHEIYLDDHKRVAEGKRRTVLRQPVRTV